MALTIVPQSVYRLTVCCVIINIVALFFVRNDFPWTDFLARFTLAYYTVAFVTALLGWIPSSTSLRSKLASYSIGINFAILFLYTFTFYGLLNYEIIRQVIYVWTRQRNSFDDTFVRACILTGIIGVHGVTSAAILRRLMAIEVNDEEPVQESEAEQAGERHPTRSQTEATLIDTT